jgi:hypothetical protein
VDPVSLVVAALAAGAVSGVGETASAAVKDAYAGLRQLVRARLRGAGPAAAMVLAEHEKDPDTWRVPLSRSLQESGAGEDAELLAVAHQVLALVDSSGARSGKYVVEVRDSQGTVIGDHTHVTQSFTNTPPQ